MHRFLAPLAFLVLPLAAQEPLHDKVTNGTFTGTLTPWVMGGGYSVNPGLESGIDVTGMGISDSFGVNAGGQVLPPPYPPNTLEQTVNLVTGGEYEFRMDAMGYANSTTNNLDIGTIWVEFNGVEIARLAFGTHILPEVKRAQLSARFSVASAGGYVLKIYFQRAYLAGVALPRMNIDNVSLQHDTTPTFGLRGNRRLGGSVELRVDGTANAPFAVFVAPVRLIGGVAIPGFGGLLHLDTLTMQLVASGQLDGAGVVSTPLAIPVIPLLLTNPLHFQGVTVLSPTSDLSLPVSLVMTQ